MVGHAPAERSQRFDEQRERLRSRYLKTEDPRPPSSGRGLHHAALVSSDVERTIRFYQDQLEFPLTELFENRDYPGSSHFFFDIGNGNLLGFFDFPNLDLGPYEEVFGGLHHVAISVEPKQWHRLRAKLMDAGVGLQLRHPIAPTIRAHVCTVDRKVRVSGQFEDKVILVTGAARARAARMPCVAEEGGRCRHRRELQEA
jgi:catechol 2,3-dioxygenase-like lactoylglutathione lyase family enzyme